MNTWIEKIFSEPKYLAVIVSTGSLALGIFKFTAQRADEFFDNAVNNLASESETVRSICIQNLARYLTSACCFSKSARRQNVVAHALSNHLIHEENQYVRLECSRILSNSNWQIRKTVIGLLYRINLRLWDTRNKIALSTNDNDVSLDAIGEKLTSVNKTLCALLKKRRFFHLNLRGIHLDSCNLIGVNLNNCDLTEATITHSNLKDANVVGSNLNRAIIIHSYFSNTKINKSNFEGAVLARNHFDSIKKGSELFDCVNNFRLWNKWQNTNGKDNCHIFKDQISIYMERELDWTGIWLPCDEKCSEFVADWRSEFSSEVVTAKIRFNCNKAKTTIFREDSSDSNDGTYFVKDKAFIDSENFEIIRGNRLIMSCEQPWFAVKWLVEFPQYMNHETSQPAGQPDRVNGGGACAES